VKAILIIVLVVAVLVGVLFTLLSHRNAGMPSAEVLERARQRARAQAAEEREEREE